MSIKGKIAGVAALAVLMFATFLAILYAPAAPAALSFACKSTARGKCKTTPSFLLSATTTAATSTNVAEGGLLNIAGAEKVTFSFTHGGTATTSLATSTFSVEVTNDFAT